MANIASPMSTYSDTTTHKRTITDIISLIDPSDAPAVNALGGLDGAGGKFRFVNWPGKVVEWLEDSLTPLADAITTASITSAATTVNITDPLVYEKGHIALIDSEQVWVSSVDTTNSVVTITRAFAGTTAATHASTATVTLIGMARLEGAESDAIGFTDRTTNSNWTQIFHQEVKVTRSHQQLSQYGISDEMAYQGDKVIPSLMRLVERHLHYNAGGSAGSATTPRTMKGYQGFVTTNKVSGASLAQSQFENAVLSAYSAGGTGPYFAFVAPANYQKIKNFYDSSVFLRIERTETTVGMEVTSIHTPFGEVNLVLDRWALTTIIPLIDPKHAGFLTYYPFTQEELAKTGDYDRSEVVGEFTFCLRQEKAHALLTAVS